MIKTRLCCRLAILALSACLLAGCTADPFVETRPDELDELPERHGVVAVQVANNARRISWQIETWTAVHVVNLDDTKTVYRLRPSGTGLLNSRVFVGALPPGRYAIFNLHASVRVDDFRVWFNAPVSRTVGTFQIDEGYLTSLGTLVYQPLGETEVDGRETTLHVIARTDEEESLAPFVVASFPELADSVHAGEMSWDPDGMEHQREEIAERLRTFAIGTDHHRLDDGRIAMSGPLGMLIVRNGPGDWQRVHTGASVRLAALTRQKDRYLVAGERGIVLAADRLEGPWTSVPGPGPMEAVYWLQGLPDGSLYALTRAADTVRFYRVSADLTEWSPLREFEYSQGMVFTGDTGRGEVHAAALPDGNVVLFGDARRILLDAEGTVLSDEGNKHLYKFQVQDEETLVALPGSLWSGVGRMHYSRDGGKNWETMQRPGAAERERPSTRHFHYILPNGGSLAFTHRGGTNSRGTRIVYEDNPRLREASEDGSILRWGTAVEPTCTGLVPSISTEERLFSWCDDGRVLISEDQGASWQVDFSPGTEDAEASDFDATI
jgi:hypothetical protein